MAQLEELGKRHGAAGSEKWKVGGDEGRRCDESLVTFTDD